MDLSALERRVSALETSLDSLEYWIAISTLLVVVGLIVEYWHPLSDVIKEIRKSPPFPWKKILEMTGGILVTVGVAGELWYQSRASNSQVLIRSATHEIEGLLNKQAADAEVRAKEAEKTTALLQSVIMPLDLNAEQQSKIGAACKRYAGRTVIVACNNPSDIEGRILASLIISALIRGGIKAKAPTTSGLTFDEIGSSGVTISGPDPGFVECLRGSLTDIGDLLVHVMPFENNGIRDMRVAVEMYPFKKTKAP